ncbi:hypothetical protein AB6A40_007570 [Gnathostoma spinigerum]|uniref:Uncharacterized protein n=1 Tax=Gnathostoma spinigerum TaxID=75299 RepID=A0ABD6ETT0_9BILA
MLTMKVLHRKDDSNASQALYYGIPWSNSTLGFVVSVTFRIVRFKPYVKLIYLPCHSTKVLVRLLQQEAMNPENDFVESIMFSENCGTLVAGRYAEFPTDSRRITRIASWSDPSYIARLQHIAENALIVCECVHYCDYLNRYVHNNIWNFKSILPYVKLWPVRCVVRWLVHPNLNIVELTDDDCRIKHCFHVPIGELEEVMKKCDNEFKIWPVRLCPYNLPSVPGLIRQREGKNKLFVEIQLFGTCNKQYFSLRTSMRRLQKAVLTVGGFSSLSSNSVMSKSEFWAMFDSSLYEWLRVKFHCVKILPGIFEILDSLPPK